MIALLSFYITYSLLSFYITYYILNFDDKK